MAHYKRTEKLIHRLILHWDGVGELLFDLEKKLFCKKASAYAKEDHVFVCGLARAGSTILMRRIYESGQFASLLYEDMPFVMAPNLWKALTKKLFRSTQTEERAHGDGISIDLQSPEAFDEVFWRTFIRKKYISSTGLRTHEPCDEDIANFITYSNLICFKMQRRRYLSKNNNNILRLQVLHKSLPRSFFLIPFRSPLQHAQNLLKQHLRFSNVESFSKSYMRWLGHYEFGAQHRPFLFPQFSSHYHEPCQMNYWLERWVELYRYLLAIEEQSSQANIYFVCYEYVCDSERYWSCLVKILSIAGQSSAVFCKHEEAVSFPYAKSLAKEADALFAAMKERSLEQLCLPPASIKKAAT